MLKTSTSSLKSATTNMGKALPHPLLLPDKPQITMQIKNRAHNIAFWKTCAHKTPTTTTKRKTNSKKSRLVEFSFLKETFNNYQHEKNPFTFTTTTKQTKNRNPNQKQTSKNNQKKRFCTQTSYNNNQKEKHKKCHQRELIGNQNKLLTSYIEINPVFRTIFLL
jgi:hypothetical protein